MRESFSSRIAYVMALAGSAIGLGNVWRFPYIVGEYGGAAFVIVYILFGLLVSLPIFFSEVVIGRRGRGGAFGAFKTLSPGTGWKNVGFFTIITCYVLVSYYSVVGGWSLDYLLRSVTGSLNPFTHEEAKNLFGSVTSHTVESLVAFAAFLGCTAVIVMTGIKKGIENFSKITTPLLFLLIVVIMIFSCTLPGAVAGIDYLFKPDFSKMDIRAVSYAMGQSFFSMSLGVGSVLIYSSFMKKQDNILTSGVMTFFFDTSFAILAGLAIMPAVFSSGLEPGTGPSLVFETLPYIFGKMNDVSPVLSDVITILFFLSIFFAALTSSIAMLEVCVEFSIEKWKMTRIKATGMLFAAALCLGGLCSLSFGSLSDLHILGKNLFALCDMLCSNYFMAIGALVFAIYVGWVMKKDAFSDEFSNSGTLRTSSKMAPFVFFLIKWVSPIMIIVIFLTNLFF